MARLCLGRAKASAWGCRGASCEKLPLYCRSCSRGACSMRARLPASSSTYPRAVPSSCVSPASAETSVSWLAISCDLSLVTLTGQWLLSLVVIDHLIIYLVYYGGIRWEKLPLYCRSCISGAKKSTGSPPVFQGCDVGSVGSDTRKMRIAKR